MSTTQTLPAAGWFADPARPWLAHRWDGERWTGETSDGRTLPLAATPSAPPDPRRRVELDELPRRLPTAGVPAGLLPLTAGLLLAIVLLPRIYEGLQRALYGATIAEAIPVWIVASWGVATGLMLYGIVTLAVDRVLRHRA